MKMKTFLLSFFTFAFCTIIIEAQIPTNGLVAFYPFNGNSIDESGNGNNGTVQGATLTIDRCENSNSAYDFDGQQSYIAINNSDLLDTMTRISLCAWIKPVEFVGVGNNSIIDKGYYFHDNPFYQYHLGITGNDYAYQQATFAFAVSLESEFTQVQSITTWIIGAWFFVVGTYDGIYLRLYINGEKTDSLYKPGVIDRYSNEIYIAKFRNYPGAYTPGVIDDIRIFNRAISAEEVLRLYYTNCLLGTMYGENEVCQGQQNVGYYVQPLDQTASYTWNYSGIGATITGTLNNVLIDFANNATSGNLTVTVKGDSIGTQSTSMPITVITIPSQAGLISGNNEVCKGQTGVSYSIPNIDNASYYTWNYGGTGVTINGNSNKISIDFSLNATSGNLTVSGANTCGSGNSSKEFPISFTSLPGKAGEIAGESEVCQNQNVISYSIPIIENASSYLWNYSGTGTTMTNNSQNIAISFGENATGGNLTVVGYNSCGYGVSSAVFSIIVNSCNEPPPAFNIPNSFSPNGDGVNDVFFIRGLTENSKLIIFDRSGKKQYESANYQNDWDGKDREDHALKSGTYWYVLSIPGIPTDFKGFVYLKK